MQSLNLLLYELKWFLIALKRKTIKEVENGVWEGEEEDWNAFGSTARFPYTSWFLKVIKEWYWFVDEGDGLGEQKEDCLQSYYEVKAVNS